MGKVRINGFAAMVVFFAWVGLSFFISTDAKAEDAAGFYKDKTIHWIVSSSAGSTTDILSRVVSQYLGDKIGAKVKVENMDRDKGLNYAFTQAKPDGLTLVSKARTAVLLSDLAKAPGVRYKAAEFIYITDLMVEPSAIFVKSGSAFKSLDALRKQGLKAGGTSSGGFFSASASIMFEIMGIDGKVVPGYKGPPALVLAVGQGEIDVLVWQAAAAIQKVKDGSLQVLCVIGEQRFSGYPDVPTFEEAGGRVPESLDDAYDLISWSGQSVMVPPGVPADKIEFLRNAFQELNKNTKLQNDIQKAVGFYAPFEPGEKMQKIIRKIMTNQNLSTQLNTLVEKYTAAR